MTEFESIVQEMLDNGILDVEWTDTYRITFYCTITSSQTDCRSCKYNKTCGRIPLQNTSDLLRAVNRKAEYLI